MQIARAIAAAIVAAAPIAVALVGGSPAQAQKMSGEFGWITCTNTQGQRCDSGFMKVTGAPNKNHTLILTASPEHCSKVKFVVHHNNGAEQMTRALGPGETDSVIVNDPDGAVLISAEGVAGRLQFRPPFFVGREGGGYRQISVIRPFSAALDHLRPLTS